MLVLKSRFEVEGFVGRMKKEEKTIGFVPTMGALHEGHLSLIRRAKEECDVCVLSVFVNPTQFNNKEDLEKYPRTFEADAELARMAGCDVLFFPTKEEIYPKEPVVTFDFGILERVMEGANRPGHFNGVAQVLSRLFHVVQPRKAYFGLKDFQQVAIVRAMVDDLFFPLEIVPCPTQREESGLALSSRNQRLSLVEKALAKELYQCLLRVKDCLLEGLAIEDSLKIGKTYLESYPIRLEYLEFVNRQSLQAMKERDEVKEGVLCIAAYVGPVRLIDNLLIEETI